MDSLQDTILTSLQWYPLVGVSILYQFPMLVIYYIYTVYVCTCFTNVCDTSRRPQGWNYFYSSRLIFLNKIFSSSPIHTNTSAIQWVTPTSNHIYIMTSIITICITTLHIIHLHLYHASPFDVSRIPISPIYCHPILYFYTLICITHPYINTLQWMSSILKTTSDKYGKYMSTCIYAVYWYLQQYLNMG